MARKNKKQTEPATTTTTAAPVAIETQPSPAPQTTQPTETKPVETQKVETTRNNIKSAKSTVANPVQVVHQLVAEMVKANPQVRRKDLVDAAVKAGCAFFTARTQVQVALKKMKANATQ